MRIAISGASGLVGSALIPVLADRRPSLLAWVVWTQSALLLAAWKLPLPAEGAVFHNAMMGLLTYAAPIAALVAFAAAGVLNTGSPRKSHDPKGGMGTPELPQGTWA